MVGRLTHFRLNVVEAAYTGDGLDSGRVMRFRERGGHPEDRVNIRNLSMPIELYSCQHEILLNLQ